MIAEANSEKPLVSYILGVYNTKSKKDLDRSIYTMLNQTYGNTEIIICDDHSTNGIYEYLISEYSNNPRIKIIRNESNLGLNHSLNKCISAAGGEYIARQDDDDYSNLNKLEKQMSLLLESDDICFVSTGLVKFDKDGLWGETHPIENPTKNDFLRCSPFAHAPSVFKKEVLLAVGGYRISKETIRCEDMDLFMRLYAAGYKGANIPEPLYYYNKSRKETNRRKFKYCYYEAVVRYKGYRLLNFVFFKYIFVLKPIIAYFIPDVILRSIKKI